LHFFNTPPGLTEDQLIGIFNIKDVPATSVRLFPLKTERSSSGLIEFPNISQAVLAIMKCNHLPIEGKGEIVLCLSVIQKKVKSICGHPPENTKFSLSLSIIKASKNTPQ